jgi:hypothetical protein
VDRETVQMVDVADATVEGEHVTPLTTGSGVIVMVEAPVAPPAEAVMVAEVELATEPALAENVELDVPADTVTDGGTVKAALLLERLTVTPAEGAVIANFTVHVAAPPDTSVRGMHDSDDTSGGGVFSGTKTEPPIPVTGNITPLASDPWGWTT